MVFILGLLSFMFLIKLVISILNYKHSIKGVQDNVKHIYDQEAYEKWLSYYRDQMKFGLISKTFNFVLIFGLLIFKVFGVVESLSMDITGSIYLQTLIFLGIYFVFSSIVEMPFEYYHTFVLEEKYGFNKSTKKTFFMDQLKSFLIVIILIGAGIFGLHALYLAFSDTIILFVVGAWLALSIVMILVFILNTKLFVKLFNKLTPLEESSLKTKIDKLASELGFEIDKISVMDASKRSTKLNAFFSGLGKHRDVVLYDTLIDKMGEEEICAVLGHELSHALNKDTTKMLLGQVLTFGVFAAFIGLLLSWDNLYLAFGLSGIHFGFAVILFSIVVEPISMLIGILTNYVSRVAEYRADKFGAAHVSKEAMIHALEILAKENFSNLNPHPLFEFISYNHPTISKRIESIKNS
ncbi:M48 family metallopeptidase [Mycoplasmatota bacterium]|nr:M48 family metallopeptidase [Mycoplasmatota bacterium]